MNRQKALEFVFPAIALGLALVAWEAAVRYFEVPTFILPAPSLILITLVKDWGTLSSSLMVTLTITLEALGLAVVGGVALAILFAQWRIVERGERLVHQKHGRTRHQRAGDRHPHLHAAGEFARIGFGEAGEAHPLERLFDLRLGGGL